MKVLIIGNKDRYEKFMPDSEFVKNVSKKYIPRDYKMEEILEGSEDIDAILIDPMAKLPAEVIDKMPKLKIIQSEGVGYNFVDCAAAKKHGIYVCNCKGANAGAVAEQTILLMLAVLRQAITGNRIEHEGHQIEMKERLMCEGITELGDCNIGLIGFGDIAKATALRLIPFGCKLYYNNRSRKSKEIEEKYQVTYMDKEELLKTCDIISLHCPVTPETDKMVNAEFLSKMKKDSYIINTARGDVVDNEALYNAIVNEDIKGAGLDTVCPEPTTKDNILLNLPDKYKERIIFSPHIGGITTSYFKRAHVFNWSNVETALKNEKPKFIVNDL